VAWEGEGMRRSGSQETGCGAPAQTLTEDEMSMATTSPRSAARVGADSP